MDNLEKLATYGTQDTRRRQTKQKHYMQASTNNVKDRHLKQSITIPTLIITMAPYINLEFWGFM
jgi:hypothetical protein